MCPINYSVSHGLGLLFMKRSVLFIQEINNISWKMYVVYNKTISGVNNGQLTDSILRGINQQNEKKP